MSLGDIDLPDCLGIVHAFDKAPWRAIWIWDAGNGKRGGSLK